MRGDHFTCNIWPSNLSKEMRNTRPWRKTSKSRNWRLCLSGPAFCSQGCTRQILWELILSLMDLSWSWYEALFKEKRMLSSCLQIQTCTSFQVWTRMDTQLFWIQETSQRINTTKRTEISLVRLVLITRQEFPWPTIMISNGPWKQTSITLSAAPLTRGMTQILRRKFRPFKLPSRKSQTSR